MARNGRLSSSEKSLILCRQSGAARQKFQLTHVETSIGGHNIALRKPRTGCTQMNQSVR